jgi:hypothetical protein
MLRYRSKRIVPVFVTAKEVGPGCMALFTKLAVQPCHQPANVRTLTGSAVVVREIPLRAFPPVPAVTAKGKTLAPFIMPRLPTFLLAVGKQIDKANHGNRMDNICYRWRPVLVFSVGSVFQGISLECLSTSSSLVAHYFLLKARYPQADSAYTV